MTERTPRARVGHDIAHLDAALTPRSRYLVADDALHGSTWQLTLYFHVSHRASCCVTGVRLPGRSSPFAVSKKNVRHAGDEDHRSYLSLLSAARSTDRRTADRTRRLTYRQTCKPSGKQADRLFWHRHRSSFVVVHRRPIERCRMRFPANRRLSRSRATTAENLAQSVTTQRASRSRLRFRVIISSFRSNASRERDGMGRDGTQELEVRRRAVSYMFKRDDSQRNSPQRRNTSIDSNAFVQIIRSDLETRERAVCAKAF